MTKKIIRIVALVIGLGLCAYPLVASLIDQRQQRSAVSTYEKAIQDASKDVLADIYDDAVFYNQTLYNIRFGGLKNENIIIKKDYKTLLNFSGDGIMGTIHIPNIDVNLPIYHGTGEDVLSVGIGHLEDTSLPVGGKNTHSVLTGHRGLPGSKLFTRLDEMEIGDMFYIQVCNQKLAYKVTNIQVIRPEEADKLKIQADKDLVSLLTCTPYGVNSHRLVVTGERTEYDDAERSDIKPQMASPREIFFSVLPFLLLAIVIVKFLRERRKSKHDKKS